MSFITKNGKIHHIPSKTGKQKGFITKNGIIQPLIPYRPEDVVVTTGPTIANVIGVALANIANVSAVSVANISNVLGVDKE